MNGSTLKQSILSDNRIFNTRRRAWGLSSTDWCHVAINFKQPHRPASNLLFARQLFCITSCLCITFYLIVSRLWPTNCTRTLCTNWCKSKICLYKCSNNKQENKQNLDKKKIKVGIVVNFVWNELSNSAWRKN